MVQIDKQRTQMSGNGSNISPEWGNYTRVMPLLSPDRLTMTDKAS